MRGILASAWLSTVLMAGSAHAADSIAITATPASSQPGGVILLTMTVPAGSDHVGVHVFNSEIPVYRVDDLTWGALVGVDLAIRPGTYSVSVDAKSGGRQRQATYSLNVVPRQFPVRVLKVDPAFVNPPPAAERRIVREAAELEQLWRQSFKDRLWLGPFVPPVPFKTASNFGARSIFNGQARSPHGGADFASPVGAPIAAPNAGRVVLARDLYFTGNTVILDHGLGLFSLLAHLSVIEVHEGDRVTSGQEIGKVGATGRVTGPHLHWGVRAGGARVDPLAVLAVLQHEAPHP
jgi:murein DD-endopeptidase MepM/ murein hydrolase activator NlpD